MEKIFQKEYLNQKLGYSDDFNSPLRPNKSYDNNNKVIFQNNNSNLSLHCTDNHHCPYTHTTLHVHHFHIPHTHNFKRINKNDNEENEILKQECEKYREELEKIKSENEIGNKYIELLENKINLKQYDNININKLYYLLEKTFEILNLISTKCDNVQGKIKGDIKYYLSKKTDDEFNLLIEAQKNWIDDISNMHNLKTNKKSYNNDDKNSYYKEKYKNRKYSKTDNDNNTNKVNKSDIIKENELDKKNSTFPDFDINNSIQSKDNKDLNENLGLNKYNENDPINKYYNYINNNKIDHLIQLNNNNINENKEPDLEEHILEEEDDSNNVNSEEENPLNKRYLIKDQKGNPIKIGGKKVFGIEIYPSIGKNGYIETDDNGNIILISPDGQKITQNDLEPILLDNDKPLVNEENKPFLGINGVPFINESGKPFIGPGELYDKNNKVVKGILGIVTKENNEKTKKIKTDENNINTNNNIKPLIGENCLTTEDTENNIIFSDKTSKNINNQGSYFLDKEEKPISNSNSKSINSKGKRVNYNKINNNINKINIKAIKPNKKPLINERLNRKKKEINNIRIKRYKNVLFNEKKLLRDKGRYSYSELNPDDIKKIDFMGTSAEYKGSCFACDVGCSVSRSGYSPMNYNPYNNMIKRKEITPLRYGNRKIYDEHYNTEINKKEINDDNNDNNYYLTEA